MKGTCETIIRIALVLSVLTGLATAQSTINGAVTDITTATGPRCPSRGITPRPVWARP